MTNSDINLVVDGKEFDRYQLRLVSLLAQHLRLSLEKMGLREQQLREAVASLTFYMACFFDGCTNLDIDGVRLTPFLGFALDRESKKILVAEGGPWFHEYALGAAEEACDGAI